MDFKRWWSNNIDIFRKIGEGVLFAVMIAVIGFVIYFARCLVRVDNERSQYYASLTQYYTSLSEEEKTAISDEKALIDTASNYFKDKDFVNQACLYKSLNCRLLKYAYDNKTENNDVYGDYQIGKDSNNNFIVFKNLECKTFGSVSFSTEEIAKQAIDDIVIPFMKEHPDFIWR